MSDNDWITDADDVTSTSDDSDNEQIDVENDTDKRQYHNLLERKRRDNLKDTFSALRDIIPSLKRKRNRASRIEILKATTDFLKKNNPKVEILKDKIEKRNQFIEYYTKLTEEIQKCAAEGDWDRFREIEKSSKTLEDFGLNDSEDEALVKSIDEGGESDSGDSEDTDSPKRLCLNVVNE
ncbi:max [Trichonephila clavata]|uniref:Max n=2 Tax=Trichonephila clavata TaxID=2740835 RepID=A0A8X6HQS4_TRICU|nr:max [Trichonephila clavata]